MKITVLGAGAWGTALAAAAAARRDDVQALANQVTLFARDPALVEMLSATRQNGRYLRGIALPENLRFSADFTSAVRSADLLVIGTPVAGLRATCVALRPLEPAAVVWLCKGFEETSGALPHQVVADVLSGRPGAVLSGPSFAQEVAAGMPTALTAASTDSALVDRVVQAFHGGALRVYRSDDVIGVEVGGAVKNVLAIATGIADGLDLGLNARAALITRGLSEMMRLGVALGGHSETLMGLTGVGDLILTCTGALSRNRSVGLALGRGIALDAVLADLGHVAEGVRCARAVLALARQHGVDMPITEAVCGVMFSGLAARDAVASLLSRAPRSEH